MLSARTISQRALIKDSISEALRMKSIAQRLFLNGGYPIGLTLCGVLLAYIVPESWGASAGPLSPIVDVMIAVVPSIRHFVAVSSFPGITATVFSVMWMSFPLLVWTHLWTLDVLHGSKRHVLRESKPALPSGRQPDTKQFSIGYKFVLAMAGLLLFSIIVVVPILLAPVAEDLSGSSRSAAMLRSVSQSRIGIGIYAALSCWICSLGVAIVWIVAVGSFRKMQIGRS
jgi:hypothetical protein